jgi:hypothetical protein
LGIDAMCVNKVTTDSDTKSNLDLNNEINCSEFKSNVGKKCPDCCSEHNDKCKWLPGDRNLGIKAECINIQKGGSNLISADIVNKQKEYKKEINTLISLNDELSNLKIKLDSLNIDKIKESQKKEIPIIDDELKIKIYKLLCNQSLWYNCNINLGDNQNVVKENEFDTELIKDINDVIICVELIITSLISFINSVSNSFSLTTF